MNLIANGKEAIDLLADNESLISGELKGFSVYKQNNRLLLNLDITLLYSKKFKDITLQFVDVLEYSFYYNSKNNFYYIEDYKLFQTDEQFYISLDPVDGSSTEIDRNDNDFVIAKEIRVYI